MTVCMVIKGRFGKRVVIMDGRMSMGRSWGMCASACARTIWLSDNILSPFILIKRTFETGCRDARPKGITLATHFGACRATELSSKRVESLAWFCVSRALSQGGRRGQCAIPCALPSLLDRHGGVVEGFVQHHAPLETLIEPFQRHNLHAPIQRVFVLLARRRCCDEVGDGLGEVAVVLGSVGVDGLLNVLALLSCCG
jgi:hypothetical protein